LEDVVPNAGIDAGQWIIQEQDVTIEVQSASQANPPSLATTERETILTNLTS
jgi:hypothetical protein